MIFYNHLRKREDGKSRGTICEKRERREIIALIVTLLPIKNKDGRKE